MRGYCALAAAAAALLATAPVRAGSFAVDPISVTLSTGNSSASVAITNQSTQRLRLQVKGYAWQQSRTGEIQLAPADALVYFPKLLALAPGETQRIRIGVEAPSQASELSYRVFVEELPSLPSVVEPSRSGVSVRVRVGVPVFLEPLGTATVAGAIRDAAIGPSSLGFDVVNGGNVHFSIDRVRVVASDAGGKAVISADIPGWYVLAGGTRHFTVALRAGQCTSIRTLSVDVRTARTTFSKTFDALDGRCAVQVPQQRR